MPVLRMLNRTFRRLDKDDFLLFTSHSSDLTLNIVSRSSWNPRYLNYEVVLEKVQKRATKCVKGLKG